MRRTLAAISAACCLAGCGGGATPAAAVVPTIAYEPAGQAKARTAATSSRPLVVEWPAAERARLETSTKRGLVVVHYDERTMEVLARCSAPGAYAYTATTPQREGVHIRDQDELRANLPLGAASLSSKLARSGELTVELSVVGTYETSERVPTRAELVGDCEGATHVVVALTTGAFQFFSGGSAEVGAAGEALGAGAGARSSSRRELISEAGDAAACKTSAAADVAPPFGCGALLRVEVARLATRGADAPATPVPGEPTPTEPSPREREPASPPPEPRPPEPPAASREPAPPPPLEQPAEPSASEPSSSGMPIVIGVIILGVIIAASVVGAVAGATDDGGAGTKDPAPAGLGKATVSMPGGRLGAWSF